MHLACARPSPAPGSASPICRSLPGQHIQQSNTTMRALRVQAPSPAGSRQAPCRPRPARAHVAARAQQVAGQGKVYIDPVEKEAAAFAPATVANLGPGFDWMGCAVEVRGVALCTKLCSSARCGAQGRLLAAWLLVASQAESRGSSGIVRCLWAAAAASHASAAVTRPIPAPQPAAG